jgi:hypothetical protein
MPGHGHETQHDGWAFPSAVIGALLAITLLNVRQTSAVTDWAERLTTIALRWRTGSESIRDLFAASGVPEDLSADEFRVAVADKLGRRPELVDAWQVYSYEKRGTPSHYLDGLQVGFWDGGQRDMTDHSTPTHACVDFLYRETHWVLHRRRVT